ncbi:unnamed protein product [Periconia digitata]|uniref:Uncharacterized protein n=1 Tax=Periconia digitata TaxID=1303443 RepID=A0A9W4UFQ5_9PLEO|nr:unnamed protein product [Periconia digitata]
MPILPPYRPKHRLCPFPHLCSLSSSCASEPAASLLVSSHPIRRRSSPALSGFPPLHSTESKSETHSALLPLLLPPHAFPLTTSEINPSIPILSQSRDLFPPPLCSLPLTRFVSARRRRLSSIHCDF